MYPERAFRTFLSFVLVGIVLIQSSWFFTAMCLMAAATLWAAASGSRRDWLVWVGMLVGFTLLADLRARMGPAVEARPFFMYVIQMETFGGLIDLPTTWLQAHLQAGSLNRGGWLDTFLTTIYVSFFVTPQVVVVYLWRKGGPFPRYVAAACLLFAGALVVHFFLPTAPPWMASDEGLIPPVTRIGVQVLRSISATLTEGGYEASANDVAAMPSLHQGLTVLAMIALADQSPKTRWVGWVYCLVMLLAITYLGEHYAVDGVVGAGMAWGAWRLAGSSTYGSPDPQPDPVELSGIRGGTEG